MKLIKVGRRRINLEYLIMDEKHDGTPVTAHIPPGGIRVTMESGVEFELVGEEAVEYDRLADEALAQPCRSVGVPGVAHRVPTRRQEVGDQASVPVKRKSGG